MKLKFHLSATLMLLLLVCSQSTWAQDMIIGGQSKSSSANTVTFDSLQNIFAHPSFGDKFVGMKVVYYNIVDYTKDDAPFPYVDGRLRDGKYKSSSTAFAEYKQQLKAKSGKQFTVVGFKAVGEYVPGFLMKDDKDTTYYFHGNQNIGLEFVSVPYREKIQKDMVGKDFIYCNTDKSTIVTNTLGQVMYDKYFINVKTRETAESLPAFSSWEVKGVAIDTTWFGNHSEMNTQSNMFPRVALVLHSNNLGDYECFLSGHTFDVLSKDNDIYTYLHGVFVRSDNMSKVRITDTDAYNWSGSNVPESTIQAANDGNPAAIYTILRTYRSSSGSRKLENVTFEQISGWADKMYEAKITNGVLRDFYEGIVKGLVSTYADTPYNQYERAYPYVKRGAELGSEYCQDVIVKYGKKFSKLSENDYQEYIKKFADDGNALAKSALNSQSMDKSGNINGNPEETIKRLKESRNPDEMIQLAKYYMEGKYVEQNYAEAYNLLDRAQELAGHVIKGVAYLKGVCFEKSGNIQYAALNYREGVYEKDPQACIAYAKAIHDGNGVGADKNNKDLVAFYLYYPTFLKTEYASEGMALIKQYGINLRASLVTLLNASKTEAEEDGEEFDETEYIYYDMIQMLDGKVK